MIAYFIGFSLAMIIEQIKFQKQLIESNKLTAEIKKLQLNYFSKNKNIGI
jgi:hypothetical protein